MSNPKLNQEQSEAVESILYWMQSPDPYYLLSGAAGTGKTFTVREIADRLHGKLVFTAPTNKATKVLRSTLTSEDYSPNCRTIHSLLGLKMEANGEVKELVSPDDSVDLKSLQLIVVDEASMVNIQLMQEIQKVVDTYNLKVLFLGDENQLPPVNEKASPVWSEVENIATLQKVMRFENQILTLANTIKSKVNHPCPSIKFLNDNKAGEGVWYLTRAPFLSQITKAAGLGNFSDPKKLTKAIAWRNTTVSSLNYLIRKEIFENAEDQMWFPGDRIILTGPAADLEGKGIGHTDDEGTVEGVRILPHPVYTDIQCYNLSIVTDENKRINLWTLHEEGVYEFRFRQTHLANEAKLNGRIWRDYWEFTDSFHRVQHGYAITAHRAQGSTYDSCFVAWNDILINRNRQEAFRCLYVACTRPKKKLILGSY